MTRSLRHERYDVEQAAGVAEAIGLVHNYACDVVLTDVRMKGESDGVHLLSRIKAERPSIEVVLYTGFGTVEDAVQAIKLGAFDYVALPVQPEYLLQVVQRAAEKRRLVVQADSLRQAVRPEKQGEFIAVDPVSVQLLATAAQVAAADSTVIMLGESGTGKELLARFIHRESRRSRGPFIPVNCGAIPEGLVESEIFGYKRGAFTGAVADKRGLVEEAQEGTLFLDEVGDMPPYLQVHLLRFLDSGETRRVGENSFRHVDARIVAATNRSLLEAVKAGRFREEMLAVLGRCSGNHTRAAAELGISRTTLWRMLKRELRG